MLIGRHDIENLMGLDPASSCLPNSLGTPNMENNASDAEGVEVELEISDLLMNLRPIKQVCISLVTLYVLCRHFFPFTQKDVRIGFST